MLQSFWTKLLRLWQLPESLDTIKEIIVTSAQNSQASADQLNEKVSKLGASIASVATIVLEARNKIAAQAQAIEDLKSGSVDPNTLAAINASIDASLDQLAQVVAPVVSDPEVPTGGTEVPPETNPGTVPPESVPVPADAPAVVTDPSAVDESGEVVADPTPAEPVVDGGSSEPSVPEASTPDPTTDAPDGGGVQAGDPAEGGSDQPQQ